MFPISREVCDALPGNFNGDVYVKRADGGADNDGEEVQNVGYAYNSATSLFYTFTGENDTNASSYCVFGMAMNYDEQMENGLLAAITEYENTLSDDASFTETQSNIRLNQYDYFEDVSKGDLTADFETPLMMPITIKSVVVTKY